MPSDQPDSAIKVALFCGGRGSATIIREFLRWPNVQLTLLVNAYDDGLSTGALRNFIPGMLGPSDFRKNLSSLLDLYSDEQYAFKNLLEFRLPMDFGYSDEEQLKRFVANGQIAGMRKTLAELVGQLNSSHVDRVRRLLGIFLRYAADVGQPFDFRDCAVGNLLFAGCYFECGRSFNAAANEMSKLVNSQATLINISMGEDRILVGLKADGQLLLREADIVGKQSSVPILDTFFLAAPVTADEWAEISDRSVDEKAAWLKARAAPTQLSPEARRVINEADIIVYGPGTQHSSLLPSYRIASEALRSTRGRINALIVNLRADHDIQGLSVNDLVDRALSYAGDPENRTSVITHIFVNTPDQTDTDALFFEPGKISEDGRYRGALVVKGSFEFGEKGKVHNGYKVVRDILRIAEAGGAIDYSPSLDIFLNLDMRTAAAPALIEEFLELNWLDQFAKVRLRFESATIPDIATPPGIEIERVRFAGPFPEVGEVIDWATRRNSEYLVTITGDGEYRFRDVQTGIALVRDSVFGAVYGSRTQSRAQLNSSVRAVYAEHSLLRWISVFGAFLLTMLYAIRFGMIFSDPLTGFRIYRRSHTQSLKDLKPDHLTPTSITKQLVRHRVEIAELPIFYRTFLGFTDPWRRVKRGILNLYGFLR